MIRQIRVIMSLVADGMLSGIRNVIGVFGDLGNIVSGIKHGFDMLSAAARGLWDTFIQGAINEQKLGLQLKYLSGSAEEGADLMKRVDEWVIKTGSDSDDAKSAMLDLAKALKASDGAIDPDKLFKTMDIVKRLSIITGMSMSEMSKVVGRALTGDVELLSRTLGISKEKLAELSPEFAKFIQNAQGAQDAQLGEVTRLGTETETMAGDALKALDEVANGLGATNQLLAESADTTESELNRAKDNWEQFTDAVGGQLLPIVTDALERLNKWIAEHPDEIKSFVDAIGNFSTAAWEKLIALVSSEEFKNFLKSAENFTAQQWEAFANAIAGVKWSDVSSAINSVADFVNFLSGKQSAQALPTDQRAIDMGLLGGIGKPEQRTDDWTKDFSWERLLAGLGIKPLEPQKVDVTVTVDGEGNLKAAAQAAAEKTASDLVAGVTGSGAPKGSGTPF
jgi:hypothetical protein